MTAAIDAALQRLRLTDVELAALSYVAAPGSAPVGDDAETAWAALGELIGTDRSLPGWIRELGSAVAAPALHMVVEVFAAEAPVVHQIWATPGRAVVGSVADDDRIELRSVETVMVPYELAGLVGLGPRPPAAIATPVAIPAPALEAASEAVETDDLDGSWHILTRAGLTDDDASVVNRLIAARRSSWRVTSMWASSPTETVTASVVVLDGGEAGVWFSEAAAEGDPETMLTLRPSKPSEVWRRLLRLLPSSPRAVEEDNHG